MKKGLLDIFIQFLSLRASFNFYAIQTMTYAKNSGVEGQLE